MTNILLKELERKANAPEWEKTLESMQKPDSPLELYRSVLKSAEEKLEASKNPFGKVTEPFVWYFQKGEFTLILAKIGRSKSTFDTLLNLYPAYPTEFKNWIEGGKCFLWCQGDRKSQYSTVLIVLQLALGKPFSGLSGLI